LAAAASKAEPASRLPAAQLRALRVLIVDDNETNRRILDDMTRGWEMIPTITDNGPAALAALDTAQQQADPFQVILIDGQMPGMDGFDLAEKIQAKLEPSANGDRPAVLMLTSGGQPGEANRCRQLGVGAYLLKPVLKDDLREAIATALSRRREKMDDHGSLVTRHTLRETTHKLKILVAEDNVVNQAVIIRVLQKMGHTPVLAQNGSEALTLVLAQQFDLVFMDVQMPEMDGFAATAAIREKEAGSGKRLPIFAMTDHAMKGDRERCLAAGMDGYIAKPVRFSDIEQTLSSLGSKPERSSNSSMPAKAAGSVAPPAERRSQAWNRTEALGRIGGDEQLLSDLCHIFLEESPKLLLALRRAVDAGDAEAVMRSAHSLKGEASYLGAPATSEAARQLEQMGQSKDLSLARDTLSILEREIASLHLELKQPVEA